MNISKKLALAAVLVPTLMAGAVNAAEPGFYLGGSFGQARLDTDAKDFGYKGDGENFTVKDDDSAWKAYIGYNWSLLSWLNVGLEGGYKDFGNFSQDTRNGTVRADPTGWDAFLVGTIPVGPVDFFAKVGGIALNRDINTPQFGQDDEDDNQLAYGVGALLDEQAHRALAVETGEVARLLGGIDDTRHVRHVHDAAGRRLHREAPQFVEVGELAEDTERQLARGLGNVPRRDADVVDRSVAQASRAQGHGAVRL